MSVTVRRLATVAAILLAIPAQALAARGYAAAPALFGKPCFLQVNPGQAVRADTIRAIRAQWTVAEAHFDVERSTLYVPSPAEMDMWRRRIMACFEEPAGDAAAPAAAAPAAAPVPPAPSAPRAARK